MKLFRFYKKEGKHQEPLKGQNRFAMENETLIRLVANTFLLFVMACVLGTTVTLRDSLISKQIEGLKQQMFEYSSGHGFGINDIIIQGRQKTTLEDLNKQINLTRENSILQVDLKTLKTKIEDLPWVEKAELRRLYFPNVLQISIKEKDIVALYQKDEKFYPVDKYGNVIEVEYTPSKPFLIIVGEGAPAKLFDLIKVVATSPELFGRLKAAVLYYNRRWDLVFNDLENGITVKMPEENFQKAWDKLVKINHKYGIFKRKLTFIDLRYKDKVNVIIAD